MHGVADKVRGALFVDERRSDREFLGPETMHILPSVIELDGDKNEGGPQRRCRAR